MLLYIMQNVLQCDREKHMMMNLKQLSLFVR